MRRVVGGAAVAAFTAAALVGAVPSARAERAPASKHDVVEITRTFVDHTRRTPANTDAHVAAARSRTLVTTIWIPPGPGPFPLIVYAHGYNGTGAGSAGITRPWAEAGYVVAAPTFPISGHTSQGLGGVADVANQPGDLRFVMTRVLALARAKGPLAGKVDAQHVGVAGHSLGAVTTLGYVERSCCRDPRVDAAISISGTPLIGGTDFKGKGPPLLLIHGDHDPRVNYAGSTSSYARATPPKYLLTVLGGLHGDFLAGGTSPAIPIVATTTLDFWNAYLKDDTAALARLPTDSQPGVTTMQSDPGPTKTATARTTGFVTKPPRPREVDLSKLPKGPAVEVFMKVRATARQISHVRDAIERTTTARVFAYVDKNAALAEFRRIFRNDPQALATVSADKLPASFRVVFRRASDRRRFRGRIEHLAGVANAALTPRAPTPGQTPSCVPEGSDLEVFLNVDATVDQISAVQSALRTNPAIASIHFVDHDEALRTFDCIFANDPKLRHNITANALPVSFRIRITPGADAIALRASLENLVGVDTVTPGDPPPTTPAS